MCIFLSVYPGCMFGCGLRFLVSVGSNPSWRLSCRQHSLTAAVWASGCNALYGLGQAVPGEELLVPSRSQLDRNVWNVIPFEPTLRVRSAYIPYVETPFRVLGSLHMECLLTSSPILPVSRVPALFLRYYYLCESVSATGLTGLFLKWRKLQSKESARGWVHRACLTPGGLSRLRPTNIA